MSQVFPKAPLVVAANRDEQLDRPSAPPKIWSHRRVEFLAPQDMKSGGTWLGLNAGGLFVGITNRVGETPPEPNRRSRGLLVLDALEERDAHTAALRVMAMHPQAHNRFHLIMADHQETFMVWSDGERLFIEEWGAGIHILTERSLDAATDSRTSWIRAKIKEIPLDRLPSIETWTRILSHHAEDPFAGTCVHAKNLNYATRSSTILWTGQKPEQVGFWHAEGPVCRTSYSDWSSLAQHLVCRKMEYE